MVLPGLVWINSVCSTCFTTARTIKFLTDIAIYMNSSCLCKFKTYSTPVDTIMCEILNWNPTSEDDPHLKVLPAIYQWWWIFQATWLQMTILNLIIRDIQSPLKRNGSAPQGHCLPIDWKENLEAVPAKISRQPFATTAVLLQTDSVSTKNLSDERISTKLFRILKIQRENRNLRLSTKRKKQ